MFLLAGSLLCHSFLPQLFHKPRDSSSLYHFHQYLFFFPYFLDKFLDFLCKLHQSQLELQEVRLSYRQLQGKVEELSEERSLQNFNTTSTSLLSEIEQSMEAEELEQEREQVFPSYPWESLRSSVTSPRGKGCLMHLIWIWS